MNTITIELFERKLASILIDILNCEQMCLSDASGFMKIVSLSRTFSSNIKSISDDDIKSILYIVEEALVYGDEATRDAVATGFLENLQNRSSISEPLLDRLLPHLGFESKKYCKAWDEFTGVNSLGIKE